MIVLVFGTGRNGSLFWINNSSSLGRISVCLAAVLCTSLADSPEEGAAGRDSDCGETGRDHRAWEPLSTFGFERFCYVIMTKFCPPFFWRVVWANDRLCSVIYLVILYARYAHVLLPSCLVLYGYVFLYAVFVWHCVYVCFIMLEKNEHHSATLCVNKSAVTGQKCIHIIVLLRACVQSLVSPPPLTQFAIFILRDQSTPNIVSSVWELQCFLSNIFIFVFFSRWVDCGVLARDFRVSFLFYFGHSVFKVVALFLHPSFCCCFNFYHTFLCLFMFFVGFLLEFSFSFLELSSFVTKI